MKKIYPLIIVITLVIFCLPFPGFAALKFGDVQTGISETASQSGVQTPTVPILIAAIIKAILGISGTVFFLMFIWGGFSWMTAGGQPDKIGAAKKIMINATIGVALIILAYTITYFVSSALETLPSSNTTP